MSGGHTAGAPSTYVSKLELTLSHQGTVRSPPPAFDSAAGSSVVGMVAASASLEGRCSLSVERSLQEKDRGVSTSPVGGDFPAAHRSSLDTTLVHGNRGRATVKDGRCINPSTASCFQVPWRYPSSCWDSQSDEACSEHHHCVPNLASASHARQWSRQHPGTGLSSLNGDDRVKHNVFLATAAETKEPPFWTSRLDVVLDTSRASSPRPVSRFHTAFTPCGLAPTPQVCSRCMAHMTDLHGSVKWHMSTCSVAVKPFDVDTPGGSHAHSVLLVPKRWKMSTSSHSFPGGSQSPQDDFQPLGVPALQITRFQVTSSTEAALPAHQTSTKEIWLTPSVLNIQEGSRGSPAVVSAEHDPNVFIFHNHHPSGAGIRNSPCPGLIPTHHKVSEISLFLASPLAAVPFQVVRESKRSPNTTILIQTHNAATTKGPSIQTANSPTISLTINPTCCPEVPLASHHSGSRHSRGTQSSDNGDPGMPFRNPHGPSGSNPHVVVSIASLESGRRVVKISVSTSRNPPEWGNASSDGYRNITLGN